jgi:hypothetical protein
MDGEDDRLEEGKRDLYVEPIRAEPRRDTDQAVE